MALLVAPPELRDALGVAAAVVPDDRLEPVCAAATDYVTAFLGPGQHDAHPLDRAAALAVAVDMWQARTAAGGQGVALDYTPGPYRMGRSLLSTVAGLVAPCRAPRTLAT